MSETEFGRAERLSMELFFARKRIEALRRVIEKIKGGHSDDPQMDAIKALKEDTDADNNR